MKRKTELILALDKAKKKDFLYLLDSTKDWVSFYKIGLIPFIALGKEAVRMVKRRKGRVFLDLKFFDIPNTMIRASLNAFNWGIDMLDFHLMCDKSSLKHTVSSIKKEARRAKRKIYIMGVTVLTSESNTPTIHTQVMNLAKKAKEVGCDGVIASGRDAKSLRSKLGKDFVIASPGVRLKEDASDQKRIVRPADVKGIVDYIIVGRPIYESKNPWKVILDIKRQLS